MFQSRQLVIETVAGKISDANEIIQAMTSMFSATVEFEPVPTGFGKHGT